MERTRSRRGNDGVWEEHASLRNSLTSFTVVFAWSNRNVETAPKPQLDPIPKRDSASPKSGGREDRSRHPPIRILHRRQASLPCILRSSNVDDRRPRSLRLGRPRRMDATGAFSHRSFAMWRVRDMMSELVVTCLWSGSALCLCFTTTQLILLFMSTSLLDSMKCKNHCGKAASL